SRRRHTRFSRDWSSDVCSSDLERLEAALSLHHPRELREVGLEPILLLVRTGRVAKVRDHLIDRVLQREELTLCTDVDRAGEIARSEERRVGKQWRWRQAPCVGQ